VKSDAAQLVARLTRSRSVVVYWARNCILIA